MDWYIGCSGFHYKHWKGTFYPEKLAQNKWFDYYCQFFNTLELNVTFYRFPKLSFLETWYNKSPENFVFAVKAPRLITHYKQFSQVEDMLGGFYNTIREGLKEKLGCVLFQMPPKFSYTEDRLQKIVRALDNSFLNVAEFRHPSWWREDVYTSLGEKNITFCGMSHPSLPPDIITNTPMIYYRLHGQNQLYASDYKNSELEDIAKSISNNTKATSSFIFFNNDIHTYAIYNARELQKIVSGRLQDQPDQL